MEDNIFNGNNSYILSSNVLNTNFTFEFDAQPSVTTPIYNIGEFASTNPNTHNFIVYDTYTTQENVAGIGLSLGTNGALAIAHAPNYYYVLLNYEGNLTAKHRYRFTIKNNISYLYVDGNLVARGIAPISPVTELITHGFIGSGEYGSYSGWANNFVLYNNAR